MSLTSYRAAPPRATEKRPPSQDTISKRQKVENWLHLIKTGEMKRSFRICIWQTWQRLTLPRLETKYHQRWSVSRPSSEWDRVQPLRHNHQVGKAHVQFREAGIFLMGISNANNQADRVISTGKLHTLLRFHTRPINVVVYHDSQGILVLRLVSRLDAFSGYPVRT